MLRHRKSLSNISVDKAIKFATDPLYREFHRLLKAPDRQRGVTHLLGKNEMSYIDGLACARQHLVIFKQGLYAMSARDDARILDAGANIGMASLYFKANFPHARITAFEPDPMIADVLQKNLNAFGYGYGPDKIEVVRAAVSDHTGIMAFASDGADGGHLSANGERSVRVVRMRDWLNEPIDLLKLDIEGAEFDVLTDCADLLSNVSKLFVEYHSFAAQPQKLSELLAILRDAGFRVHIQTDYCAASPMLDAIVDNRMDLRLNIFATRQIHLS
jgi:FkbM family methyltransferase